ncbi:Fpg/Nei family DNA glycosylase [Microbacterium sp. CJ88]|uniref:Fpg/Nei family DNA glycosylase n=1 Tax=Microbacterium sp. CJ88 TaxID=3445672 RepID=UPI003F6561A2
MPESPEVEALAEFVAANVVGRTVASVAVAFPKALKAGDPSALIGCRVAAVSRHGKLLDLALIGPDDRDAHLVVHWGHDGWLLWHDVVPLDAKRAGQATLMARVRLHDGSGFDLTDAGQWKALSMFVVSTPAAVPAIAKLGPDPTDPDFTVDDLARVVSGRRKQLKALLQDQNALAGIGNAYSDEILHAARLSPVVHASALSPDDIGRLFAATRGILSQSMDDRRGLAPDDLKDDKRANMRVHRRPGADCPVCGGTIAEIVFSGAAAQYCPTCQTDGVPLT